VFALSDVHKQKILTLLDKRFHLPWEERIALEEEKGVIVIVEWANNGKVSEFFGSELSELVGFVFQLSVGTEGK
jgi:hypothetical protein